jgi:hypothetical protein
VSPDQALEQSRLRVEVVAARIRLRLLEQKHEQVLEHGSPSEVVEIGREYAAAVQAHTTAVMAWLSAIERYGYQSGERDSGHVAGG